MKQRFMIATVAAVVAIVSHAADKQQLPKELPPYGELKPLTAPRVSQAKLANGMTVWLAPKAGFPKVAFTLAVRGGFTADLKDRPGFADLVAGVVTQGTKSRTAKQVAEDLQAAGGDLSADATSDAIFIRTNVLSAKADSALSVLADVMQNAAFTDEEVSIAKKKLASTLKAQEADPNFLGTRALYRAMFGEHPYAVTAPTEDSIAKTTPQELRSEYARRFRPDRALLVAVGDFNEQALLNTIRQSFDGWRADAPAAPIDETKPAGRGGDTIAVVPRSGSVQTALYLGVLGPTRSSPDFAAARVANAIFGGMFGSRLVNNIREDKGYTYSPGARLAAKREAGVLVTNADVRNPVTGASFNEIAYELNRMATTAPQEQELERAKRYLVGVTAIQLQSRAAVARQLAELWIDSLPPEELGAQSEKIEKVTSGDVRACGRKYFPASRMTIVAVGEEQVIKDELRPFGFEFTTVQ
jgi:zinc protease